MPPDEKHIHVFVPEQEREIALALQPECLEKLLWGGKVVGVRVLLSQAKPAQVNRLITQAWASKAPKKLVAMAVSSGATRQ